MLKIDSSETKKRYEYILRWMNMVEKYVKYDPKKDDYIVVSVMEAQMFKTKEEAEACALTMVENGYEKPEVVEVICKAIA